MKQRTLLFVLTLLSTLTASAYEAEVWGIFYDLNALAKTATVTSGSTKYTGSVTIPELFNYDGIIYNVTSIGSKAFKDCSGLTSVTIPNSVTSIGNSAFSDCSGLASVTIPNSVTEIGNGAFRGCSSLTSLAIPNSVTSIDNYTFYECSGLISVTIPNGVTSIGEGAFSDCTNLKSLTIGCGVRSIAKTAFANCKDLTDVYCYAESVPSTHSNAFDGTKIKYTTLYVPEASIASYIATAPWSEFGTIKTLSGEIPVTPKCATPTIAFADGELLFSCETEGVEYVYNITPPSAKAGISSRVSMPTTYKVTVYATKDGYENSEVATKDIEVGGESAIRGDVNLDGEIGMPDVMFIVNYILNGKFPDEE